MAKEPSEGVKLRAEGDTWRVRLSGEPASREDASLLVFFCETTDQRPYRVAEVPRNRVPDAGTLASLDEDTLRELFRGSVSMGAPRSYPTYG